MTRVLTFPQPKTQPEPQLMEWMTEEDISQIAEDMVLLCAMDRLNNPERYEDLTPSEIVVAIADAVGRSVQQTIQKRVSKATHH